MGGVHSPVEEPGPGVIGCKENRSVEVENGDEAVYRASEANDNTAVRDTDHVTTGAEERMGSDETLYASLMDNIRILVVDRPRRALHDVECVTAADLASVPAR